MDEPAVHLLVDFTHIVRTAPCAHLQGILSALPGVLTVHVFPEVGQAELVLAEGAGVSPADIVEALRVAGYSATASKLPSPREDSDYARYYYAKPESSEARWVD